MPGRSLTRPPRTSTTECSCRLCPSPGMYAVTSIWLVRRTRATLRSAEFGFFGVVVYTRVQTPRRWGAAMRFLRPWPDLRPGVETFFLGRRRPLRTSWLMLGMRRVMVAAGRIVSRGMDLDHHRGGTGEPLVLIHGIGHTWRGWKPMLPHLEPRFDVLAVDLPGFGHSPPLPAGTEPTPEALADAVERAMDEAGFDRAHVAGNSLGGWIALELARRGRALTVTAISPAGLQHKREKAWGRSMLLAMHWGARNLPARDALVATP